MNELAMKIRQPKRRGEWVELRFMAAAAEHDLRVTKPWGDSAQYDFILEHDGRFVRIQVKSTQFKDNGAYPCAVHGRPTLLSGRRLRIPGRLCRARGRLVHHSSARVSWSGQRLSPARAAKFKVQQVSRRVGIDEGRSRPSPAAHRSGTDLRVIFDSQ